jgi:hypothetical protein
LNRKAEKEHVWRSQGLDDVRELQKMERVTVSSNPAYDIQITRRLSRACLGKFADGCGATWLVQDAEGTAVGFRLVGDQVQNGFLIKTY